MNNKRIDNIWFFIIGLIVVVTAFTVWGWMDWSDEKPQVKETTPVSIEDAVKSGGLTID